MAMNIRQTQSCVRAGVGWHRSRRALGSNNWPPRVPPDSPNPAARSELARRRVSSLRSATLPFQGRVAPFNLSTSLRQRL